MSTSKSTRRDLIIAALMLLAAGLLYLFLQRSFYVDRMKVKGAEFSLDLEGNLTHLKLTGPQFRDQDLKLIKTVSTLKNLDLKGSSITDLGLNYLAQCQKLERLNLSETQMSENGMRQVSKISNLRHLYLTDTEITDQGLKHLTPLSKLEWLDINGCERITVDGIASLEKMPALKQLYFEGVPFTYQEFEAVHKHLSKVAFAVDIDPELGLDETNPLEESLNRHTGELSLRPRRFHENIPPAKYAITADLLNRIPHKKRVVLLQVNRDLSITEEAILALRQFPNLKSLALACHIDSQTLQVITSFSELKFLSLTPPLEIQPNSESLELTHSDLAALTRLKNLRGLSLTLPNANSKAFSALRLLPELRSLFLQNNGLTDEEILFLQDLGKLERIGLRGNQLTETSLETLKKLPNLFRVDLNVNPIDLKKLKKFHEFLRERRPDPETDDSPP